MLSVVAPTVVTALGSGEVPGWLQTSGVIGAVAFGLLSAYVPPLNAEVYALAIPLLVPDGWIWHILAMTAGFMIGKVSHYVAAARGMEMLGRRWRSRDDGESGDDPDASSPPGWWARSGAVITRWTKAAIDTLERPVAGPAVVFASGLTGIPPFAVITVAAGARQTGLTVFTLAGTAGCLVRFVGTAALVALAAR